MYSKKSAAATIADAGNAGSGPHVIKKYPNRRLYDTHTSSYITLAEVKQLVMKAQPFVVRDAKTNEDLTRSILLQIILEEEAGGAPMFSEAMLANMIRFYGHAMQGFMGSAMERNIQVFADLQTKMAEQGKAFTPEAWMQMASMGNPMLQGMMDNSRSMMEKVQEQMFGAFGLKR